MKRRPTAWFRRLLDLAELAGDMDQKDIAARMGVSPSAITAWKEGKEPRPDAVRAAARAYHKFRDVDTDELAIELLRIAYLPGQKPAKKTSPKVRGRVTRAAATYRGEGVARTLAVLSRNP